MLQLINLTIFALHIAYYVTKSLYVLRNTQQNRNKVSRS